MKSFECEKGCGAWVNEGPVMLDERGNLYHMFGKEKHFIRVAQEGEVTVRQYAHDFCSWYEKAYGNFLEEKEVVRFANAVIKKFCKERVCVVKM